MQQPNKVPKLRFPGFTGEWEERKLEQLASFSKGSGYSKSALTCSGTPLILYGRLYTNYETVISNVDTYAVEKKSSVFSKGGEVIVPASDETAADISVASVIKKPGVMIGGDLNVITPNQELESVFLALNITYGKPHKDMSNLAQGKSVVHLHNSDLKTIDLLYPSIKEQKKIGVFFANLSRAIALQQRKLASLKSLKKALLQKMFPKEGKTVPELRFPGFTGEWEEKKFGDIGKVAMCKRIFKEETSPVGEVPFFKIGTFGSIPDAFITRAKFEEYKSKYPYPKKGDILISASGSIGRIVEFSGKDEYFQDSNIIWLAHDSSILNVFLKHLYAVVKWNGIEGTTIKRLYNDNVLKTSVSIPSIEEQEKIGAFFSNLDNSIILQQRKLDSLKSLKKGLLQQMFVG